MFVKERDLVTVPPGRIEIAVMPAFARGVALATCETAGPLETRRKSTFNIAPVPDSWSPEQRESFFREYNRNMLLDLTVHEAMPGHHLQLLHAYRLQAPTLVRVLLPSSTFAEGWATYAEQLMAEHGFGGSEFKVQALKMRLRVIINAIIDHGIHAGGMAETEAMRLLMEEGFQERSEAASKYRRACLSSCQLSTYYVGNLQVNAIREAWSAQRGAPVREDDLKEFHDLLLSFGSPPPRALRELMGL
jgi:uncharacterized protein (DUF885 family)